MYKRILSFLLSTAYAVVLFAQPQSSTNVLARAELSHTALTIGDQVELKINISAPSGTVVKDADWRSSNAGNAFPVSLEIVADNGINTIAKEPELLLEQRLTIQTFDTGYVFVPALAFPFQLKGSNTMDTAYTEPLMLTIKGVPLNDQSELMPINAIIDEGRNWQDFWPLYLGLFLLIGAVAVKRWLNRKANKQRTQTVPPPKSAHEVALEALSQLEKKQLWQSGDTKKYYSELSDILRVYLESRFHIPAMESTTKQISIALKSKVDFDPQQGGELSQLLQLSDMVKFAKAKPDDNLHQSGLERVRTFVNNTVPSTQILNDQSEEE